ncbi:MAG: hypothetical protein H0U69_15140 [Trueperaceae bacterium]|nr:hypothetical protein [Trueperaceae bacterium]
MGEEPFTFTSHGGVKVRIFWQGRCIMTVGGRRGEALAADLADATPEGAQRLLQRVTGNFKRGNER